MKYVRRSVCVLLLTSATNGIPIYILAYVPDSFISGKMAPPTFWYGMPLLFAVFLYINIHPLPKAAPIKRIRRLAEGVELLWLFTSVFLASLVFQAVFLKAAASTTTVSDSPYQVSQQG